MFYSLILTLYLVLFAVLFEKKGFRWKWFLALASAFIVVTLLSIPLTPKCLDSAANSTPENNNVQTLTTVIYIFFCPIHAFITVHVMNATPKDSDFFSRYLTKGIIYIVAALLAGALFTIVTFIAFILYKVCSF